MDEEQLKRILEFCAQNSGFCDLHLADIATEEGTIAFKALPQKLTSFVHEITDETVEQLAEFIISCNAKPLNNWPHDFREFITTARSLALPRSTSKEKYKPDLERCRITAMGTKKRMEVERLTELVVNISNELKIDAIIDIGSGNGYLSNNLSRYFPIISVEQNEKLMNNSKYNNQNHFRSIDNGGDNFKIVNVNLKVDQTNFDKIISRKVLCELGIIKKHDDDTNNLRLLVVGLHACGDLSALLIPQIFHSCNSFKCAISIGCCYQRKMLIILFRYI